jgi:hypothetical protein
MRKEKYRIIVGVMAIIMSGVRQYFCRPAWTITSKARMSCSPKPHCALARIISEMNPNFGL